MRYNFAHAGDKSLPIGNAIANLAAAALVDYGSLVIFVPAALTTTV